MTNPIFLRLVWKEYRVQRGFWISMAAIALAGQLLVLLIPQQYVPQTAVLYGLALGVPVFYALGCGATLFAAEREDGTLEQLRILSAPGATVWWSKVSFAVASTVALFSVLGVLAFNLSVGRLPPGRGLQLTAGQSVLTAAEFLAWGLFFSLLLKRPLHAACFGAVAELLAVGVTSAVASVAATDGPWLVGPRGFIMTQTAWRLMVLALVLAVDAWIALKWVLDWPVRRAVPRVRPEMQTELERLQGRVWVTVGSAFLGAAAFPALFATIAMLLFAPWRFGHLGLWKLWATSVADGLAWGILVALLARKLSIAGCVAAAVGFVQCHVLSFLVYSYSVGAWRSDFHPWLSAMPARLLVDVGILVVDCWLLTRWFARARVNAGESLIVASEGGSALGRLVWQERRQAWKPMGLFCVVGAMVLAYWRMFDPVRDDLSFAIAVGVGAILASLMGSCVFLAEQEERRFRFFSEHGVSARQVWWAKQFVWFPFALVASAVFLLMSVTSLRHPTAPELVTRYIFECSLVPLIAFSAGQLTSMLIPRGLIAGFAGLVVSAAVLGWALLMSRLELDFWWSVLPVPAAFLFGTWLRAPHWVLERGGWRGWGRLAVLLAAVVIGLPMAVEVYRVLEIPGGGPGFSPHEVLRPVSDAQHETAEMYRRATESLRWSTSNDSARGTADWKDWARDGWDTATPAEKDWLDQNRPMLKLLVEASQRPSCILVDPAAARYLFDSSFDVTTRLMTASQLLLLEARRLESDGQLDEALDQYVALLRMARHIAGGGGFAQFRLAIDLETLVCDRMPRWAAHPDQTPDRIRKALRLIDEIERADRPISEAIKADHVMLRRAYQTDFESLVASSGVDADIAAAAIIKRFLPLEFTRTLRLLDFHTAEALRHVSEVESALARGTPPPQWRGTLRGEQPLATQLTRWKATTLLPGIGIVEYWGAMPVQIEMRRRVLRLILAVKAWQAEHGEFPPSLDVLVGDHLSRLPLDRWTGKGFGYLPKGFDQPVRFESPIGFISKPSEPLLWAPSDSPTTGRQTSYKGTAYPIP